MPDPDQRRLTEVAFPVKQASIDSVHEKNVRHGHIKALYIWPARRPLAACRAALFATLLPDPGPPEKRKELLEKIGGKVATEVQKKKVGGKTVETVKERTEGGVLHWPNQNSPDMDWFREEIKKAYGDRAPGMETGAIRARYDGLTPRNFPAAVTTLALKRLATERRRWRRETHCPTTHWSCDVVCRHFSAGRCTLSPKGRP